MSLAFEVTRGSVGASAAGLLGGRRRLTRGLRGRHSYRAAVGGSGGVSFGPVTVIDLDTGEEKPLRHHRHHSPDGFSWGYSGSGPCELARCILIDYFDLHSRAQRNAPSFKLPVDHKAFCLDYLAAFDQQTGWEMSDTVITGWVARQLAA